MSALTAQRNTIQSGNEAKPQSAAFPVGAAKTIYKGSIVVLDAGYAEPGNTDTGLLPVGVAHANVDNSAGSAGDLNVEVRQGRFWFDNSSAGDAIAQAQVGGLCYIVDDHTVAKTDGSASRSIAGTICAVSSSLGVLVEFGLAPAVDGTSLVAEIAAREAVSSDLASTANAKGASLVGIEDSAGIITATTVEGALAEKLDGRRVANLADDSVIGGVPVRHIVAIADGVTADKDIIFTHKSRITGITVIKGASAGGASDTIQVKKGATAITDAMDLNVAAKTVVRPTTIDEAQTTIAAAGTLRVTKTKASAANVACSVIIDCVRVA